MVVDDEGQDLPAGIFYRLMTAFLRYQELRDYVGWKPADAERVKSLLPMVRPYFNSLINDFYSEIERHPAASKVITGGTAQIARLKQTLHDWLQELFSGSYDQDYVQRRWRVGYRHVDIGLDQAYANAALSRLRVGLLGAIAEQWRGSVENLIESRRSLNLLVDLDMAIIDDAYQTEHQRRQNAAERLATIGKVAGGIAHELRNPLNVVKTSIYFLLNSKNVSEEKRRTHLERIEKQVTIANGVITALNDFARLPIPEIVQVRLKELLSEVVEQCSLPSEVQVQWELVDENLAVLGDASQLAIVFANLVRNARDAMAGEGTLRIAARKYERNVILDICDTGKGISPENIQHIFEPLYSTKAKGIGLGLSISRDIVERHQGTISVSSEPAMGTKFTIRLPAVV